MPHDRIRLFQLRRNGELLLASADPGLRGALTAVESPEYLSFDDAVRAAGAAGGVLAPLDEREVHVEQVADRLAELVPATPWVLVVPLLDELRAVGPGRAAVHGPGGDVVRLCLDLLASGYDELFLMDPADGAVVCLDVDGEWGPDVVTIARYALPS